MVQAIKVVMRKKNKLVLDLNIELEPAESRHSAQLVVTDGGESLGASLKPKQRFHLKNHVHYGHQVNLGHNHANSAHANRCQLLRSPAVEQPVDWLEQIVDNKAKMIEMHAF